MGVWHSLVGIYYQPAKVFEAMRDKPRWLVPLAAAVVVTVLVTAIIMKPLVLPEQAERVASNPDLSNEQREAISERMNSPLVYWSGIIGALVSQPVMLLLAQFDIFMIWTLAVMAIGYSVYTGVKRSTAYYAVFGMGLAWALAQAALGGMFHFGMR